MKKWNKKKKLLALIALILTAAMGAGVFFLAPGSAEPVGVYPFFNVGMTEYWGDSQESYGPVSTDNIQTVFLTDTQTVTEILVKEGDTVKKGDVLMTFDTTLSGLSLERKRLEVEKQKLQVDIAQRELQDIKAMKPMEEPTYVYTPVEPFLGDVRKDPYELFLVEGNDGTAQEQAVVCWLREDVRITDALLEEIRRKVWGKNAGVCEHELLTEECELCTPPVCKHNKIESQCEVCSPEECEHEKIKALCELCTPILCRHGVVAKECLLCKAERCKHDNIKGQCNDPECYTPPCIHGDGCAICHPKCVHGNEPAACPTCNAPKCVHGNDPDSCTACHPQTCVHGNAPDACLDCPCEHTAVRRECTICNPAPESSQSAETPTEAPTDPTLAPLSAFGEMAYRAFFLSDTVQPPAPTPDPAPVDYDYYVVFKVTEGNYQLGSTTTWQGFHVQGKGRDFSLKLFDPMIADYSIPDIQPDEPQPAPPEFDMGSGYTLAQIVQMRREKEKQIKELEFDLKMKETEYKIMQTELEDGNVYADIDGEVISLLTEEEAKQNRQPMVKVSGGGGFLVEGTVSELEKDKMEIGQEVTINDWNTGGVYTGTIRSLGDFPDSNGYWNGMGNPNTTYYPFTVFIDGTADLQAGSYVSVTYSSATGESGIYLENPFLRTEQGKSYVYVLGPGGKLEKRDVVTGKSLWGSYTEILSGLSETDLIAFPYGKNVKPGAPAEEREISELYSY